MEELSFSLQGLLIGFSLGLLARWVRENLLGR